MCDKVMSAKCRDLRPINRREGAKQRREDGGLPGSRRRLRGAGGFTGFTPRVMKEHGNQHGGNAVFAAMDMDESATGRLQSYFRGTALAKAEKRRLEVGGDHNQIYQYFQSEERNNARVMHHCSNFQLECHLNFFDFLYEKDL